ncbi:MAG: hypothetical protein HKO65_00690 [Gemmatimonadetes bacterium]|nr:hypothetical protein [Gemmatimonadota bacterium]
MIAEGGSPPPKRNGSESEAVLRAKYLDYCSAQVADILLLLSPDEMFVLAQDAAREAGLQGDLSYDQIVDLATGRVSRKLALPSFEVWVREYRTDPSLYEEHLMGLWKSDHPDPEGEDPT